MHVDSDHVGVAVRDVEPGPARAVCLNNDREFELSVTEPIPLGHKVALVEIAANADVVEYGVRIGIARANIKQGALVHVHNIRSARWQKSS